MASTYTSNAGIELIATGEQSGTWGNTTNTNLQIIDRLTTGVGAITLSGSTHTLATTNGVLSDGQYAVLVLGGSLSGPNTVTLTPNTQDKVYIVKNNTGQNVVLTQGSGGNVTVAAGKSAIVYADGAGAGAAVVDVSSTFTFTGTLLASNNLSDLTSAPSARTNLGLGTIATQAASNVTVTGGNITGITDLAVADGGTGASNAAGARTNLGVAIGTDVLAYDSNLQAFVNTFTLPATDGSNGQVLTTNGAGALSFTTVSGGGGGTVTSVAVSGGTTGLTVSGSPITTSGTITLGGTLAVANGGTGSTDAATARTNLGLAIGTNVQAYDADLGALANVFSTGVLVRTGSGSATTRSIAAGTGIIVSNGDGVAGNPTISATATGTVTSITAGSGLTGGTITGSGTIAISSSYAPNSLSTASGSAPSYSARSWVNFNGTSTPSINASGNVSSITDTALGRFIVNFTTAMPNSNYSTAGSGRRNDGANDCNFSLNTNTGAYSTTQVAISFADGSSGNLLDPVIGCVVTFA